jgi:hypothetical protein
VSEELTEPASSTDRQDLAATLDRAWEQQKDDPDGAYMWSFLRRKWMALGPR